LENLVEFISEAHVESWQWQVHYVLMMWLSMVVIVPFDLETIDSKKDGEDSLLDKIVKSSERFL